MRRGRQVGFRRVIAVPLAVLLAGCGGGPTANTAAPAATSGTSPTPGAVATASSAVPIAPSSSPTPRPTPTQLPFDLAGIAADLKSGDAAASYPAVSVKTLLSRYTKLMAGYPQLDVALTNKGKYGTIAGASDTQGAGRNPLFECLDQYPGEDNQDITGGCSFAMRFLLNYANNTGDPILVEFAPWIVGYCVHSKWYALPEVRTLWSKELADPDRTLTLP